MRDAADRSKVLLPKGALWLDDYIDEVADFRQPPDDAVDTMM